MIRAALAVLILWAWPVSLSAHEVTHRVEREGPAVVVTLAYGDGAAFNYESVEIFRPGGDVPFQVGRTDARGRATFLPDTSGTWRLRAFSADGHGTDINIQADGVGAVTAPGNGLMDRYPRLIGGLAILLGAFGLMSMFYGRGKG